MATSIWRTSMSKDWRPELNLQIIDCIDFNPRLRCLDLAVDIAFLAMDLDYHGQSSTALITLSIS